MGSIPLGSHQGLHAHSADPRPTAQPPGGAIRPWRHHLLPWLWTGREAGVRIPAPLRRHSDNTRNPQVRATRVRHHLSQGRRTRSDSWGHSPPIFTNPQGKH